MFLKDLILKVRVLLNDTEQDYRWSDDLLLQFLKDAICRLQNIRPSTRYIDGVLTDLEWPSDLSLFRIPETLSRWEQGFVYYASARALEMDAADTVNQQLAIDFMSKAEARFQS